MLFASSLPLRRVLQACALALAVSASASITRAPDLARYEARFGVEVQSQPAALATYLKDFAATVEKEWFTILEESGARPPAGSQVTMRFVLNANGEVDIVGVDDRGSGRAGVWVCADALQRQQPYAKWSKDMIAAVGSDRTLTVTFVHR